MDTISRFKINKALPALIRGKLLTLLYMLFIAVCECEWCDGACGGIWRECEKDKIASKEKYHQKRRFPPRQNEKDKLPTKTPSQELRSHHQKKARHKLPNRSRRETPPKRRNQKDRKLTPLSRQSRRSPQEIRQEKHFLKSATYQHYSQETAEMEPT